MNDFEGKLKMSLKANDCYALGITLLRAKILLYSPFDTNVLKSILASA